jgi:hypothetical protein
MKLFASILRQEGISIKENRTWFKCYHLKGKRDLNPCFSDRKDFGEGKIVGTNSQSQVWQQPPVKLSIRDTSESSSCKPHNKCQVFMATILHANIKAFFRYLLPISAAI